MRNGRSAGFWNRYSGICTCRLCYTSCSENRCYCDPWDWWRSARLDVRRIEGWEPAVLLHISWSNCCQQEWRAILAPQGWLSYDLELYQFRFILSRIWVYLLLEDNYCNCRLSAKEKHLLWQAEGQEQWYMKSAYCRQCLKLTLYKLFRLSSCPDYFIQYWREVP